MRLPRRPSPTLSSPIRALSATRTTSLRVCFKYTGGGCGASTNPQEGKHKCDGAIDPFSAIMVMAGDKKGKIVYTVTPSAVVPDDEFAPWKAAGL